ncbi:hypothetical protein ykris0001_36930 [Yersinia kristensenii ATCC 33638]|nr:hypothetical protein ykris0001_19920 [Yersinia kristensenii ATCC 33638]EEP91139.1 hypothetical protein ykris0001_36930 [Yersinia kristensenii ATCC 33638]
MGLSFPLQMSHKQPILLAVMISRKPPGRENQIFSQSLH